MTLVTAELTLTTVKLNKSILKQMVFVDYNTAKTAILAGNVVGWIHGSVIGDEDATFLLLKVNDSYGLWRSMPAERKKYVQIFIA